VDHYHYLVRLVAAWLFRWQYQSKIPKNRKLDSHFTGHRDHTCHINFAWGDLVLRLIEKRQVRKLKSQFVKSKNNLPPGYNPGWPDCYKSSSLTEMDRMMIILFG
jgi:hypothetical protein